ncbi:hypothetical protein KIPB_007961, partial [Kipferlia bialata]
SSHYGAMKSDKPLIKHVTVIYPSGCQRDRLDEMFLRLCGSGVVYVHGTIGEVDITPAPEVAAVPGYRAILSDEYPLYIHRDATLDGVIASLRGSRHLEVVCNLLLGVVSSPLQIGRLATDSVYLMLYQALISLRRTEPSLKAFFNEFSRVKSNASGSSKKVLSTLVNDANDASSALHALVTQAEGPFLVYEGRTTSRKDVLDSVFRDGHGLSRVVRFIGSFLLQDERPEDGSGYIPLGLSDGDFFGSLLSLLAPGLQVGTVQSALVASATLMSHSPYAERAERFLHSIRGQWLSTGKDGVTKYPEHCSPDFVNVLYKAALRHPGLFTEGEAQWLRMLHRTSALSRNLPARIPVKTYRVPHMRKCPDYKFECCDCHEMRSFTVMLSVSTPDGFRLKCGSCLATNGQGAKWPEFCRDGQSYIVACKGPRGEGCGKLYAISTPQTKAQCTQCLTMTEYTLIRGGVCYSCLKVSPNHFGDHDPLPDPPAFKCHACRNDTRPIRAVQCSVCKLHWCDPSARYTSPFTCPRCNTHPKDIGRKDHALSKVVKANPSLLDLLGASYSDTFPEAVLSRRTLFRHITENELEVRGRIGETTKEREREGDGERERERETEWDVVDEDGFTYPTRLVGDMPIQNGAEVGSAVRAILERDGVTHSSECSVCFRGTNHPLHICDNSGCAGAMCRNCATSWYEGLQSGHNVPHALMLCPFCRSDIRPKTLAAVNRPACVLLAKGPPFFDPACHHAWCTSCDKVTPFCDRECAGDRPVVQDHVCAACQETRLLAARKVLDQEMLGRQCPGYKRGVKGKRGKRCEFHLVKVSGCSHVQCPACQSHSCYRCGYLGETSGHVYAHMQDKHGTDTDPQGYGFGNYDIDDE